MTRLCGWALRVLPHPSVSPLLHLCLALCGIISEMSALSHKHHGSVSIGCDQIYCVEILDLLLWRTWKKITELRLLAHKNLASIVQMLNYSYDLKKNRIVPLGEWLKYKISHGGKQTVPLMLHLRVSHKQIISGWVKFMLVEQPKFVLN